MADLIRKVIFIPGITGTTLINSNSLDYATIYSSAQRYFTDLSEMKLQMSGLDDESPQMIIERSHIESIVYKEVVNMFTGAAAKTNPDIPFEIFIFGYDWRKSNAVTATLLIEFVAKLRRKSGNKDESFYFITHSMGALVLLSYLQQCKGDYSSIAKIAFTVPPFRGSVEALKSLVIGQSFLVTNKESFRKVARTLPSMYELLPDYTDSVMKDGSQASIFDKSNWQDNLYASEAQQDKDMLVKRLIDAQAFREQLTSFMHQLPKEMYSRMVVLAGYNETTLEQVLIENGHQDKVANFFNFESGKFDKKGDGTVGYASSHEMMEQITTLDVPKKLLQIDALLLGQHAVFLMDARVQTTILRFFTDREQTQGKVWYSVVDGSVKNAKDSSGLPNALTEILSDI